MFFAFCPLNNILKAIISINSFIPQEFKSRLFSEDFGVPQKRHRAFFFAVRDDIRCEVDLANSPVFHFKKYAHVKFSEIQEKISEQAALKDAKTLYSHTQLIYLLFYQHNFYSF
jgi:site-specific DNA-cytosine methylase